MGNEPSKQWQLEFVWWIFAFILAVLVILPIYFNHIPFTPFYLPNIVYVVVAITLTRIIFFLPISWLRDRFYLQGVLAFLMIPLVFWMVWKMNTYTTYLDNRGPDVLVLHLSEQSANAMNAYMSSEYFFFGIWAVVAAVILPFRVIYNVWSRYIKKVGPM